MKCSLMGRCGTSLISFPSIWGWSKDQELPRQVTHIQEGNKCRRIWNSQGFRRNSCFPLVPRTEELHVFPWKQTKKNLKCDFEMPKYPSAKSQWFVSCICWITFFLLWKGLERARPAGNEPLHPNNALGCYFAGCYSIVQSPSSPKLPGCVCEDFCWVIMKDSAFQSIWDSLCPTSVPAVSSVGMSSGNNPQRSLKAQTAFSVTVS